MISKACILLRSTSWSLLLGVCACAQIKTSEVATVTRSAEASYRVTLFDDLSGANVQACFGGFEVRALRAASGAMAAVDNGCAKYEVRFQPTLFTRLTRRYVVVSQTQWMWTPEPVPQGLTTAVRFELPSGARVSVPWPQRGDTYHPDRDAYFLAGFNVFGEFTQDQFSVGTTSVEVARVEPQLPPQVVRAWLRRAVELVASVGDEFPVDRLHVVAAAVDAGRGPVAFGMVRRGGGPSVLLLPSARATLQELERDWVAVHELSHLWLPRLRPSDRWLSEGIATYLQEVLRARCGLQTAETAWRHIQEGFERGRRSGTGTSLTAEAEEMARTGAFHRVYWAGTAFALEADVRLRQDRGGSMSLIRALAMARAELSRAQGSVSAATVLQILDHVTGAGFLEEMGRSYEARASFPTTDYLTSEHYAAVRGEIMAPRVDECRSIAEPSR
jgi:hypothetical protein